MWIFQGYQLLFTLLTFTVVESSILRGPNNIVGIFHENVTLKCRSDESQKVKWTFTPMGKTVAKDQSEFPGHHSTSWSSRGYHSLTLEKLTFLNAGRYVCRVGGASGGAMDAMAAFLVVVANPPHCTDNVTDQLTSNDRVSMECSVTFVGQHNLTLEWLAPDGHVLLRHHYWSIDAAHVARLPLSVTAYTAMEYNLSTGYKCRAYFGNRTTQYDDEASNSPAFRRNICTVLLPASTVSPTDASTHAPPLTALETILMVVVCLLAGALVIYAVYFGIAKIKSALHRGRGQSEGGPSDNPDNTSNNAQCGSQNDNSTGGIEGIPLMTKDDENDQRETLRFTDAPKSVTAQPQNESDQQLLSGPADQNGAEVAAAANDTTVVQPSHQLTTESVVSPTDNHPRPVEPQTTRTCTDDNGADSVDINRQESAINSPLSANSTISIPAGHDDADTNMIDLHLREEHNEYEVQVDSSSMTT